MSEINWLSLNLIADTFVPYGVMEMTNQSLKYNGVLARYIGHTRKILKGCAKCIH